MALPQRPEALVAAPAAADLRPGAGRAARVLVKARARHYPTPILFRAARPARAFHQRLFPLNPVPATSHVEQLNIGVGRRSLAIGLSLLIPALMLVLLLSFRLEPPPVHKQESMSVVSIEAAGAPEPAPAPKSAQPEPSDERVAPPQPAAPAPTPPPPPTPTPAAAPTIPPPSAAPPPPPAAARPPSGRVYGPPNIGGSPSSSFRDSERVGTAPNGEALYAASWYREPSDAELRGYLSTASGPGWGLIACRTAPDYRVEDCVALDEYPNGSQINRAVLAAAWQFKVRPPRIGGKSQVGAWVRIRIDYGTRRGRG